MRKNNHKNSESKKMNKHYIFAANWKMNLDIDQELNYVSSNYDQLISLSENINTSIILCPSFVSLYPINKIFQDSNISIGAQDCSNHTKGSFTGQVSAISLHNVGCQYCLIGHSERRQHANETNQKISQKFSQLVNHKVSPILCIGETSEEHKQQSTIAILTQQLQEIFNLIKSGLIIPNHMSIIIAYEPIWSIGTGNTPSIDHLENIFAWLLDKTEKIAPNINWKFLYGGSINSKNSKKLKTINNLDGFLIGKASLDFAELEKIVKL